MMNKLIKLDSLRQRAEALHLHGLLAHWQEVAASDWVEKVVQWEVAAKASDAALRNRLRYFATPDLLCIDEVGYLSYSNRHADLLFELISRRYESKNTLVTTNKPFAQWTEVFPNAGCVVSLVDRLVHHAEIISIEGESYRLKKAKEQAEQRTQKRKPTKGVPK